MARVNVAGVVAGVAGIACVGALGGLLIGAVANEVERNRRVNRLRPPRAPQVPAHLCVPYDTESRCWAAQTLVRPHEVAHLFSHAPTGVPQPPLADMVAGWFRETFAAGGLRYIPDPQTCDRWSSPAETLLRGGEDCDGLAILATSMLLHGDVDCHVAVGRWCNRQDCQGHAWVEGRDAAGWFLLEATSGALHRHARPGEYKPELWARPGFCQRAA